MEQENSFAEVERDYVILDSNTLCTIYIGLSRPKNSIGLLCQRALRNGDEVCMIHVVGGMLDEVGPALSMTKHLAFFPLTHLPLHWLQFSHRKKLFPSMPFICTSIPTAFALSSASEQSRLHSATHTHTHDTDRSAARKKCVDSRQMKIIHWLNGSQCAVGQSADTLKCASCLLSKRGEIKGEDVDGPWSLFSVPCSQLACQ